MPLFMIRNDITKVSADVIVNPANEGLQEGSGTSRAVYLAAGEEELAEACRKIGHCALGTTVATPAFGLPAKYIFHAVGPIWIDGRQGEEKTLLQTYHSVLQLAEEMGLESVATPLLSAGSYGFPKEKALQAAIRAISDFLMEHDLTVYLVLYDRDAVSVSKKLFSSIEEYIDDHYIEANDEEYYGRNKYWKGSLEEGGHKKDYRMRLYGEDNHREEKMEHFLEALKEPAGDAIPRMMSVPIPMQQAAENMPVFQAGSLEQRISRRDETFSQTLLRLIDERGRKDSDVYKRANVDRRHFSKIRNDINYSPNKKTVFAFAIALELSLAETEDLLMRAGYAFSCCSKFDVIIQYFIENQSFNIFQINELLFAYGQPTLGE